MRSLDRRIFLRTLVFAIAVLVFAVSTLSQSTLQDHPTPLTRNEVEATIKARDVGDARLTTHYYWFDGSQGDVFINWISKNFAGDVDLFVQSGLRSLTKIVVYPDFGEVETGRVIYLRKPERLLLRIQGRTPNDEAATYRLKFAGSFVAATPSKKDIPALPSVGEGVAGAVRVNSVGTILPPLSKPVDTKTEIESSSSSPAAVSESAAAEKSDQQKQAGAEEKPDVPKLEVVVDDPVKKEAPAKATAPTARPPRGSRSSRNRAARPKDTAEVNDVADARAKEDNAKADFSNEDPAEKKDKTAAKETTNSAADPLGNVQLVIMFKDGRKIERPLPEVFRFSVDGGVLTVVSKNGRVGKYQMIDVAKVTIE